MHMSDTTHRLIPDASRGASLASRIHDVGECVDGVGQCICEGIAIICSTRIGHGQAGIGELLIVLGFGDFRQPR